MKKKKRITVIVFIVLILIGVAVLLYPTVSEWLNEKNASKVVDDYQHTVTDVNEQQIEEEFKKATAYNEKLYSNSGFHALSDSEKEEYDELLNLDSDGMMGYVEIPGFGITMPIYHGTEESVLQSSVGHVDWSSLPVGGENTHSVIAGHRALPGARLFTDLDKMQVGDIFILHVLDKDLYYEVEKISTVLPEDVSMLQIEKGRDLCTLVTCTPYAVNTHRLLITGHRIEEPEQTEQTGETTLSPGNTNILIIVAVLIVIVILVIIILKKFGLKK